MTTTSNQNSSSFGWLGAGFSLVTDRVDAINQRVGNELSAINDNLTALSQRGEKVEAELCQRFRPVATLVATKNKLKESAMPFGILDSINPFTSNNRKNDERLAVLSAKVDLLVEQVALLAAKEATARQAAKKQAEAKKAASADTEATPAKSTARKTTRTKAAAAKKPATESAKTTTAKPAARKSTRRTTTKPKTTAAKKETE